MIMIEVSVTTYFSTITFPDVGQSYVERRYQQQQSSQAEFGNGENTSSSRSRISNAGQPHATTPGSGMMQGEKSQTVMVRGHHRRGSSGSESLTDSATNLAARNR